MAWWGACTTFALLFIVPSAWAGGDLHEVSWGHANANSVERFVVFVSPERGALELARQIDVGKPAGQKLGTMRLYSAIIEVATEEFVAVAAIGRNGMQSAVSAWGKIQPSQPGQPFLVEP